MSGTSVFDDDVTEAAPFEVPAPVAQTVAKWRAAMVGAQPDIAPAVLRKAAIELWRVGKVANTVHPACCDEIGQAIADELYEMAIIGQIDDETAQYIIASAMEPSPLDDDDAPALNGVRQDEPPPAMSPDEFGTAAPEILPTGKSLVAFPLVSFENIRLDTERRGYLIKGLLPRTGLAVIWGPPKCGKSFLVTDMALHIALGWKYRGRRVQQAPVVYLALEGRHGLPARKEAFRQYHGLDCSIPFYLVTTSLNLVKQADALIASIQAQLGDVRPGAVFIDTLNRSLVGSESKDEDMAAYLAAAGNIEQKFGCLVPIVHHCGIDATRPRGHTSLSGAVEVQIAVKRGDVPGEVIATVELAKDLPEGDEIFSRLESVEVGTDPDGDPITSRVVVPADIGVGPRPPSRKGIKGLSAKQRLALEALSECTLEHGIIPPPSPALPQAVRTVTQQQWRDQLLRSGVIDPEMVNPRAPFFRLMNSLQSRKLIGVDADMVWRA